MAKVEEGKKRMATLVGCNYPHTKNELRGCINDVLAMKDLLVGRFGFDPADIVVLTDEPGSALLPTGANIRAELGSMVDRAAPGDVLFFHYSGHGTLIPAAKPHLGRRRLRRREEAIVPCDFNLITDVDFRELVDRLPGGALFTMVSDSCHSGGLIDKEKEQIGPYSTLPVSASARRRPKLIPLDSVLQHLTSLSGISSPHVGDHLCAVFGANVSRRFAAGGKIRRIPEEADDNAVLLSGCQADETSADISPEEAEGKKAYGAFSHALQVAVVEAEKSRVMSNRQLVVRVRELLREQGFEQHPCLYCSDGNADAAFLWV